LEVSRALLDKLTTERLRKVTEVEGCHLWEDVSSSLLRAADEGRDSELLARLVKLGVSHDTIESDTGCDGGENAPVDGSFWAVLPSLVVRHVDDGCILIDAHPALSRSGIPGTQDSNLSQHLVQVQDCHGDIVAQLIEEDIGRMPVELKASGSPHWIILLPCTSFEANKVQLKLKSSVAIETSWELKPDGT